MAKGRFLAIVVQARLRSTRLPGKVLMQLGARSALAHCLRRCQQIKSADAVVCAVPEGVEDDLVAETAKAAGAFVVRGDEQDVLSRYAKAARACEATHIMRVTSDCPLIDPTVCDRLVAFYDSTGADYACNNMPPSWPHGLDCDLFRAGLLYDAEAEAQDPYDREHVTPWIRRREDLVHASLLGPGGLAAAQRWTLDYPEDYEFLSAVFAALGRNAETASAAEIMSLLTRRTDITDLNASRADPARIGSGQRAEIISFPERLEAA